MSTYKNVNYRGVEKLVKQYNFVIARQKGSHITIFKPDQPNSEFTIVRNSRDSYSRGSIKNLKDHLEA
jgi:predicted RNA binding protein YcfA (HicA-like mRNA interferase family)